jgi:hypothetical protein
MASAFDLNRLADDDDRIDATNGGDREKTADASLSRAPTLDS